MNIGTIQGTITLIDNFSGPLKAAQAGLAQFHMKVNGLAAPMAASAKSTKNAVVLYDQFGKQVSTAALNAARAAPNITKAATAVQSVTTAASKAGKSNDIFGESFDRLIRHVRNTIIHVTTAVAIYKTMGAAIDSIAKATEFDRTLTRIANVTTTTAGEVAAFNSQIGQLIEQTGRGPQELAEGFYAVSSTVDGAVLSTQILTESARLAALGLGETNDIARALAGAINSYGAENLSAADAASQLWAVVKFGGAEADSISLSFGKIVSLAADMGVSFAEVGASVATFTRLGVSADVAVTSLRATLIDLLKPTKSSREALAELGLTAEQLRTQIRENGLADTLINLVELIEGSTSASNRTTILSTILDNSKALVGTLSNAGSQADAYRNILDNVVNSTEGFAAANENLQKSASFQWDQLLGKMELLKLQFGQALLPAAVAFVEALANTDKNDLLNFADSAVVALKALATIITLVVDNISILKAAVIGLIALKLAIWLSTAQAGFVALRASMMTAAAAAGPLGLLIAALVATGVFINDKLKNSSREAQAEIDRMVQSTLAGGRALQQFMAVVAKARAGQLVTPAEANLAVDSLAAARAELAKLRAQQAPADAAAVQSLHTQIKQHKTIIDIFEGQRDLRLEAGLASQRQATTDRKASEEAAAFRSAQAKAAELAQAAVENYNEEIKRANLSLRAAEAQWELIAQGMPVEEAEAYAAAMEAIGADHITDQVEEIALLAIRLKEVQRLTELVNTDHGNLAKTSDIIANNAERTLDAFKGLSVKTAEVAKNLDEAPKDWGLDKSVDSMTKRFDESWELSWANYKGYAFDAIDVTADHLKGAIKQAAMEGSVDWQSMWDSLMSTLLDIFLDMLEEMLRRWIATQAAMAATDYASKGGGGMTGKGTTKGGDFTSTASSAAGLYQQGSAAGMSTSAMAGAAVAAFALYVVYVAFIEDHKKKFASTTLGGSSLSGVTTSGDAWHGKKHMQGLQDAVSAVREGMVAFLEAADIELTKFADVKVTKQGEGWYVGGLAFAKSAEAAADAAIAYMVIYGEFADSVSLLVKTAVKNTKELSTQAIAANIEFARMIEDIGKTESELGITALFDQFRNDFQRAIELFYSNTEAFVQAVSQLGSRLASGLMAAYRDLTGTTEKPADQLARRRQEAEFFNAQKRLLIAELGLKRAELEARHQFLLGSERLLQAQNNVYNRSLEQIQAYLNALNIIIGQLTTIPDIDPNDVRLPGGGSGGGSSAADDVLALQRMLFESTASDYAQAMQAIIDKWKDAIPLAHGNALLIEQINLARERELALLRQQAIQSAVDKFQQFMGIGQDPFSQLRDSAQDAVDAIMDSPMGDARKASMIARIWRELGRQIEQLAMEMQSKLFGSLAGDLEALGLAEEQVIELRRWAAIMEHQLKVAHYRAEFELLKQIGQMPPAMEAAFNRALEVFESFNPMTQGQNAPFGREYETGGDMDNAGDKIIESGGFRWKWQGASGGWMNLGPVGGTTAPGGGINDGGDRQREMLRQVEEWQRALKAATDLLRKYQRAGLDPLTTRLIEITGDFQVIRKALGDTAEVMSTYAMAVAQAFEDFLAPIQELKRSLAFSAQSPYDTMEQFAMAQAEFAEMQARWASGDLNVVEEIPAFIQEFLALAQQVTPVGSEGYSNIFESVNDFLNDVLALSPEDLGTVNNPMSVSGIEDVVMLSTAQLHTLERIHDTNAQVAEATAAINLKLSAGTGSFSNVM